MRQRAGDPRPQSLRRMQALAAVAQHPAHGFRALEPIGAFGTFGEVPLERVRQSAAGQTLDATRQGVYRLLASHLGSRVAQRPTRQALGMSIVTAIAARRIPDPSGFGVARQALFGRLRILAGWPLRR